MNENLTPIISEAYSNLWNFFFNEHNLILLNEQMDEIVRAVDQFKEDCKKENNQ